MASIGPKKSLFKRRAGPVIVQKIAEPSTAPNPAATTTIPTPTSLTSDTTSGFPRDGGAFTTDSDSSPPRPAANDPGIDLFRRAKHFFPKTTETPLRAGAKQAQNQKQTQAGPIGHDPKRRKVSSEQDGNAIRSRSGSLGHDGHDGHDRHGATPPVELRDSSGSPLPPTQHDKGKGVATTHTVNAGIVFTDASNPGTRTSPEAEVDEDTRDTGPERDDKIDTADDSVIILDDSDTDNVIPQPQPRPRKDSWEEDETETSKTRGLRGLDGPAAADSDGEGAAEVIDPEFEEYIIRARAQDAASRAAREVQDINAQLAANARRSVSDDRADGRGGTNDAEQPLDSQATVSSAATAAASDSLPQPMTDQSYRIFITSRLPVAVPPLIANVRMDQELRHVKNAFLSHALEKGCALPPEVAKSVLLTWKGAKIYDFTTGHTLNLNPDARGRFQRTDVLDNLSRVTDGSSGGGGGGGSHKVSAGFISGGLHIEIWTEELYEKYIADQEKQRRRNMGETLEEDLLSDDDDDEASGYDGELAHLKREGSLGSHGLRQPSQQAPDKIRLVLTSRSYDKLSVTAHTDTTIDTLIQAFRIQRGIAQDTPITIWMDGEQLAGGSTVGDADMEDLDSIEVHV